MGRLGDLIKLERTRRGLEPKAVAKKAGISVGYLLEVEAGTRIIRDDQARRILKTMGMEQPQETDFTLDDIASTVDLQSAMPRAVQSVQKKKAEKAAAGDAKGGEGLAGSIWLNALSGVLQHVPIYNAVMKEVGSRLLFMDEGKILEDTDPKVFFENPQHPRAKDFLSKVL